jgi:hypothetical protein
VAAATFSGMHRRNTVGAVLAVTSVIGPFLPAALGAGPPARERSAPGSAPIVIDGSDGFDWGDASIGAAAGVGTAVAAAGAITLVRNKRKGPIHGDGKGEGHEALQDLRERRRRGCGRRCTDTGDGTRVRGLGPATPNFNLEAQLRPVGSDTDGFGLVKFRQPKDAATIVDLDVWVRGLAPSHSYFLERATDAADDHCMGANWLKLGQGLVPQPIPTDQEGTGRAELFRGLPATLIGTEFDIQFHVIDAATSALVLESACYQFTVSQ